MKVTKEEARLLDNLSILDECITRLAKEEITINQFFDGFHPHAIDEVMDYINQPTPTNEEVEELLNSIYTFEEIGNMFGENTTADGIPDDMKPTIAWINTLHKEDKHKLKTYFTQQAQHIKELEEERNKYKKLTDYRQTAQLYFRLASEYEEQKEQLQAYKELLDTIKLTECENPKCTLVNGIMVGMPIVDLLNKLKQLSEEK